MLSLATPAFAQAPSAPVTETREVDRLEREDDGKIRLRYLPAPVGKGTHNGEASLCYDVGGMRALFILDVKLQTSEDTNLQLNLEIGQLYLDKDSLKSQLVIADQKAARIVGEKDRISKRLEEDNKAKHEAEQKPSFSLFGEPLPWIITGVVAVIAGGFVIAWATK